MQRAPRPHTREAALVAQRRGARRGARLARHLTAAAAAATVRRQRHRAARAGQRPSEAGVAEAHVVHAQQVVIDLELDQVADVRLERLHGAARRETALLEDGRRLLDVGRLHHRDVHKRAGLSVVTVKGRAVDQLHVEDALARRAAAQCAGPVGEHVIHVLGKGAELRPQRGFVSRWVTVKRHK